MLIVATRKLVAIDPRRFTTGPNAPHGFFLTAEDAFGGPMSAAQSEEALHRFPLLIPWRQVTELSAVQPWPALRIAWKLKEGGGDARVLTPPRKWFSGVSREELEWERVVLRLFERVAALGFTIPGEPGWTQDDDVEWELGVEWPSTEIGGGGYRTGGMGLIIAERAKPTPLEFMMAWLAAGPRQPWTLTAREVAITRDHVYARLAHDGRPARLPLDALRGSEQTPRATIYRFGRRTPLVLPSRESCPVTLHLDRIVASRRA